MTRLRIALQKSGRLAEPSLDLLKQCGLRIARSRDKLYCYGENMPEDLLLVRDDDIPRLLQNGSADLGIVGRNVAEEERLNGCPDIAVIQPLDFGGCTLKLAVPEDSRVTVASDLAGKRVATSYPRLTAAFFEDQGIDAEVATLTGSVEIAPSLGVAEAICDLVSTGSTLRANHLVPLTDVFTSSAAIYARHDQLQGELSTLAGQLLRRVQGVQQVKESKYVMLHAPRDRLSQIRNLLPGAEAPTVLPLEGCDDKVAVHAVCRESVFWEHLEALEDAGASAVLVLPVEKMLA